MLDLPRARRSRDSLLGVAGPRYINAAAIGSEQARATWALAARERLVDAASSYHSVVTYDELASFVQERALVRTTQQPRHWIGDVLRRVALECERRGEPNLSALCVNTKGGVGAGYAALVAERYGDAVGDPDEHAAAVRLDCHRHFGADLPPGGGIPALPPTLRATKERKRKVEARDHPKPTPICPRCFLALPATGVCDNCA